jgi:hypothetical protein
VLKLERCRRLKWLRGSNAGHTKLVSHVATRIHASLVSIASRATYEPMSKRLTNAPVLH